jgi:hypothetical protein
MTTAWVRNESEHGCFGVDDGYVHHIVNDLVEWLDDVLRDRV